MSDKKRPRAARKPRLKMMSRKLRFPEQDMNKIQLLADHYAGGNFSKWVRYAALNCPRKVLVNEDQ